MLVSKVDLIHSIQQTFHNSYTMKSLFFAITLSISVSILALNCDHQGQWDFCNLGLSPESQIVWSSDANFKNATTQRYTDYKPPTYQASIIPASETDVQKIVC